MRAQRQVALHRIVRDIMKKFLIRPAMAVVVLTAILINPAQAQSPVVADPPATPKAKKKAAKSKAANPSDKVAKAKFLRGSEESTAERNARLKRECKGGVNAGACAGFTR